MLLTKTNSLRNYKQSGRHIFICNDSKIIIGNESHMIYFHDLYFYVSVFTLYFNHQMLVIDSNIAEMWHVIMVKRLYFVLKRTKMPMELLQALLVSMYFFSMIIKSNSNVFNVIWKKIAMKSWLPILIINIWRRKI